MTPSEETYLNDVSSSIPMAGTVSIPKAEYDLLIKCRHIVESEFEGKFSAKFIKAVKQSEKAYKKGDTVKIRNSLERKKLFDAL